MFPCRRMWICGQSCGLWKYKCLGKPAEAIVHKGLSSCLSFNLSFQSCGWTNVLRQPAPRKPSKTIVAKTIVWDGSVDTDDLQLEGRVTLLNGTEMRIACGGTLWYEQPRLMVTSASQTSTTVHLRLPIRAQHKVKGEGFLGLIASVKESKSKAMPLPFWNPPAPH